MKNLEPHEEVAELFKQPATVNPTRQPRSGRALAAQQADLARKHHLPLPDEQLAAAVRKLNEKHRGTT